MVPRPVAFDPRGGAFLHLLPPEGLQPLCPSLFQDLLDPARWRMLIQQFRYDNYRLHQLGNSSVFTLTLQAGLSAIKTPYPSAACSPVRPESGALRPARRRPRGPLVGGSAEIHPTHTLRLVPVAAGWTRGSLQSGCVSWQRAPDIGAFPHRPREASGVSVALSLAVLWLVSLDELTRWPHFPQSRSSFMVVVRRCNPKAWGPARAVVGPLGLPLRSSPQDP